MQQTSIAFKAHVDELLDRAQADDEFALKSLSTIALIVEGWHYGDPDPSDNDDDPGGGADIIELHERITRLAA